MKHHLSIILKFKKLKIKYKETSLMWKIKAFKKERKKMVLVTLQ